MLVLPPYIHWSVDRVITCTTKGIKDKNSTMFDSLKDSEVHLDEEAYLVNGCLFNLV